MSLMRSRVQSDQRKMRRSRRRILGSQRARTRRMSPALQVLEPRHLLAFSTELFVDINQLGVSAIPDSFVELNSEVFFVANDGRHGSELWKSDGSSDGTTLVADINPGVSGSLPANLTVFGGDLYFTALDANDEYDLWKTDGSTSGVVKVFDADAAGVYELAQLTASGNRLFFTAYQAASGYELWATDGTSGGTQLVRDINLDQTIADGPSELTDVNGKLFFTSYTNGYDNRELFESDGSAIGTVLVANVDGDPLESSAPHNLTNVNGVLYFAAEDSEKGVELFKSTGANGTTVRIGDINVGNDSSYPESLTPFDGQLFFTANDGVTGRQLYKTDGSAVTLVANTTQGGAGSSSPAELTVVGDDLFFVANGGAVPGPITASQPNFSSSNSFRSSSSNFAGIVSSKTSSYQGIVATATGGGSFTLPSGASGNIGAVGVGLSGIEIGDFVMRDMDLGSDVSSTPTWEWTIQDSQGLSGIDFSGFASGNSFITSDEAILFELFLNGSATRTAVLEFSGAALNDWSADRDAENLGLSHPGGPSITSATVRMSFRPDGGVHKTPNDSNEAIVIRAALTATGQSSGVAGREIHMTDGTTTELVKDIVAPGSSEPVELTEVGGKLFFSANDPITSGRELWTSDGTSTGTQLVKDIRTGFDLYGAPLSGDPRDLTNINGTLFFSAVDDLGDRELWTRDGNTLETNLLKNIDPSTRDADIQQTVEVGSKLFFVANDGVNGEAVWVADLDLGTVALAADVTASQSDRINGLAKFGNGVIFHNDTLGVYTTDGITTSPVTSQSPIAFNDAGDLFVEVGGLAYFVLSDAVDGEELWKVDGATGVASLVVDLYDGSGGSVPRDLVAFNNQLYFSANSLSASGETLGRELYRTSGSANTTQLVKDINIDEDPAQPSAPISLSSDPQFLTVSGSKLYFTAESGVSNGNTGRELWVSDGTSVGTKLVDDIRGGSNDSNPFNLTDVGGVLYFAANDGSTGFEPFRTEGTSTTTDQLANINGGVHSSNPRGFLQAGLLVYFAATEANTGEELYVFNGTPGTATRVSDLQAGVPSSSPTPLAGLADGRVLVAATGTGTLDRELWIAGGAINGLVQALDMNPGEFFGSDPADLIPIENGYVFIGNDGLSGRELYRLEEFTATVESQVIDDGTEQRSSIGQFQVTFNAQVDIAGDAFRIREFEYGSGGRGCSGRPGSRWQDSRHLWLPPGKLGELRRSLVQR